MTPPAPQEQQRIDWHGKYIHVRQEVDGLLVVSRHPFESIYYPDETKELVQFFREYHSRLTPSTDALASLETFIKDRIWKRKLDLSFDHKKEQDCIWEALIEENQTMLEQIATLRQQKEHP